MGCVFLSSQVPATRGPIVCQDPDLACRIGVLGRGLGWVTEVNLWKQGSDPKGKKPLENPPENQLEISYTGKSPTKIGSLDMS